MGGAVSKPRPRYARRALAFFALAWLAPGPASSRAQDLSQAIASWAEATVGRSSQRWVGQRVPMPEPTARPDSVAALDSELWPLRIHLSGPLTPARLELAREVLLHAEHSYALLTASGVLTPLHDASPGGPLRRDLYLVDDAAPGAGRDDSELVSALDGASAFALLSTRTPAALHAACVSEALVEARLLELDPAEHEVLRKASARYFARLLSGDFCAEREPRQLTHDQTNVLREPDELARWLWALGARQDRNRGLFMQDMWQFARQRTWEGSGLRGSPDLFEAIATTIALAHDKLEEIAGELANASALAASDEPLSSQRAPVRFSRLPAHLPASAALGVLDSSYTLIDLEAPHPNERLTVWSRGEYGVRWVLAATRLDASGHNLGTVNAPVHKHPDTELTLELDQATRYVLVSLTNFGNGLPDADVEPRPELARSGRLIVARSEP